tara:strand:+ start:156 stop:395 length:240 start_codon:yes stop_codon:yes gene_type:complete
MIGTYICTAGIFLMLLSAVLVRLFFPEGDARYRTGYKNNEEVSRDLIKWIMYLFMMGVGLTFLGLIIIMYQGRGIPSLV